MKGTACPECGNEVMSFFVFFRRADINKVFHCAHCGAELKRPTKKVLSLMFGLLVPLLAAAVLITTQDWPWEDKILLMCLSGYLYLAIVKFVGWKSIGWVLAESVE